MGLLQRMRSATLRTPSDASSIDNQDAFNPTKTDSRYAAATAFEPWPTTSSSTSPAAEAANKQTSRPLKAKQHTSDKAAGSFTDRSRHHNSAKVSVAGASRENSGIASSAPLTPSASTGMKGRPLSPSPSSKGRARSSTPPISARQQEAATRLSQGSPAHSPCRRKSPSPVVPAMLARDASPSPTRRPQSIPRPAGIPARPTMAAIRAGRRPSREPDGSGDPRKTRPASCGPMIVSSPSQAAQRPVSTGSAQRHLPFHGPEPRRHPFSAKAGNVVRGGDWEPRSLVSISADSRECNSDARSAAVPAHYDSTETGAAHLRQSALKSHMLESSLEASPEPQKPLGEALPQGHAVPTSSPATPDAVEVLTPSAQLPSFSSSQAADSPVALQQLPLADQSTITPAACTPAVRQAVPDSDAHGARDQLMSNPEGAHNQQHHAQHVQANIDLQDLPPAWQTAPLSSPSVGQPTSMVSQPAPVISQSITSEPILPPDTPSPQPVVPIAQCANDAKPALVPSHNMLKDLSDIMVPKGPVASEAQSPLPSVAIPMPGKDSDAAAVARGPDTPEAHAESPFAKAAAHTATDTSSAATSGSASKASTGISITGKQVNPPPPGPKAKKAAGQPIPPPARTLFAACCSAMPLVKGDSSPPAKRPGHMFTKASRHQPPQTPTSRERSHAAVEQGSSPSSPQPQRFDSQTGAQKQSAPVSVTQEPKVDDMATVVDSVPTSPRGRRRSRRSGHYRSSSVTSVSSLESFHSAASRRSRMSMRSTSSGRRSRTSRRPTNVDLADMQVKGFEHLNAGMDPRSAKPLRSALRQSHSGSSLDGSEYGHSFTEGGELGDGVSHGEARAATAANGVSPSPSLCSSGSLVSAASTTTSINPRWRDIADGLGASHSNSHQKSSQHKEQNISNMSRAPSATWSVSSSELDGLVLSASPSLTRIRTPQHGMRSYHRSESTELFADVDSAIKGVPVSRTGSIPRPIAVSPPPSDILNSGGSTGRSPNSQLQRMWHLREKVDAMRADTERSLASVTVLAAKARARRASPPNTQADPLKSASPRAPVPDATRLQEQKAKLQRRLEQLSMQQLRLEMHIKEAAEHPPSPSPSFTRYSGEGTAFDGMSLVSTPSQSSITPGDRLDPAADGTSKDVRRRVTFGASSPPPPQEDSNYVKVVDAVAGLRDLVNQGAGRPAGNSSHSRKPSIERDLVAGVSRRSRGDQREAQAMTVDSKSVQQLALGQRSPSPPSLQHMSASGAGSHSSHSRRTTSLTSEGGHSTSRRRACKDPTRKHSLPSTVAHFVDSSPSRVASAAPTLEHQHRRGRSSGSIRLGGNPRPTWVDEAVLRSGGNNA